MNQMLNGYKWKHKTSVSPLYSEYIKSWINGIYNPISKPLFLLAVVFVLTTKSSLSASIKDKADKYNNDSFIIIIGGYVNHILPNQSFYKTELNEGFNNKPFILGIRIDKTSHIMLGTLFNTFKERSAFIGYKKSLYNFTPRFSLEGMYAYVGEFFFDAFSDVGGIGEPYYSFKKNLGIGFAPYIYHGLEYDINSFLSIDAGFIIPFIAVATLQIRI